MIRAGALLLVAGAFACSSETLDLVEPEPAWKGPLDVLFVIDDSGRQSDAIEARVAASIPTHDENVRIGAISDSVGEMIKARRGSIEYEYAADAPHEIAGANVDACEDLDQLPGCVRDSVVLGSCARGTEMPIQALRMALDLDCNKTFFRKEAELFVIIVSDDDETTDFQPVIDELERVKGLDHVRVSIFAGAVNGEASWCQIPESSDCGQLCDRTQPEDLQYPEWCKSCSWYDEPDCCMSEPSTRLVEFAHALGDRARISSVCAERFDFSLW